MSGNQAPDLPPIGSRQRIVTPLAGALLARNALFLVVVPAHCFPHLLPR